MADPSLDDLEAQRDRLYGQLTATGDFRRGSISENYRRCGKPNCACAQPDHRGHGPRYLWTRTVAGRGTKGRQLSAGEVDKVRGELANYQQFAAVTEEIVAVNEAICEARPPNADPVSPRGRHAGRKRGLYEEVEAEFAAEVSRLSELAVRSLGSTGEGMEAVELAIRTAMTRLGASLLGQLLATDTGHRGPRIDCGAGHLGEFVSYRTRTIDTVLGPVELRRAYYHCATCRRGVAPRDDELGVTGVSLSPGLRKMTARAAAAVPFAKAADLLAELAGIRLPAKRIERSAEADGAAAAARFEAESAAIARGRSACCRARRPRPGAGQALHRHRRHRRADGGRRGRRPRRQGRRRAGPHPRGQTGRPVHPDQDRRRRPAGARPGLHQLPGQLRPRGRVRHPGTRRGPPPRRRRHPPTRRPRRRGALDLEPGHRDPARGHPHRGPLPRPRTPARPRRASDRRPHRRTPRLAGRPPGRPRRR